MHHIISSLGRPSRLTPLLLLAAVAAVTLSADPAEAKRNRLRKVADEELALVFVGGAAGVIDGRSVKFIGIDEEFVRLEYGGEKFDVPNDEFDRLKLSGASWVYKPSDQIFIDMVKDMSRQNGFEVQFKPVGNREDVTNIMESAIAARQRPVAPEPDPEPAPSTVASQPSSSASTTPTALPDQAPAAAEAPEEGLPFDVPDWLKYAAAAAAVFVVIQFFRN